MPNALGKKQGEMKSALMKLLELYGLEHKLTADQVIKWVWTADGKTSMEASNLFQKKCFQFFAHVKDIDEMNRILQIMVDMWNHFPHRALGGKSPYELSKELYGSEGGQKQVRSKNEPMPKVICGGEEFSWDEYWQMIKECEKAQKPFRQWIKQQVLPAYKKHLRLHEKDAFKRKKHEYVARIFFERALHLGFVTFGQMHQRFVWNDFPHWWQSHVIDDNQTEREIRESLKNLSDFLYLMFSRGLPISERLRR